jgi:hypothetical protein
MVQFVRYIVEEADLGHTTSAARIAVIPSVRSTEDGSNQESAVADQICGGPNIIVEIGSNLLYLFLVRKSPRLHFKARLFALR